MKVLDLMVVLTAYASKEGNESMEVMVATGDVCVPFLRVEENQTVNQKYLVIVPDGRGKRVVMGGDE